MSILEKSILSTIVYYDVLGLPLTNLEVYKYLIKNQKPKTKYQKYPSIGFIDVKTALEDGHMLGEYLDQKNGFHFLKGRDSIVKQRITREKTIQEKWKGCKWTIKLLGGISFVRMVGLSGSMAVGNASKASDIDLLIIVKIGRIWTARLLVTILLSILGKRRYGRFIKNRICLNHYITDKSLKINFPSLYNAQTYVHLFPVLGDKDLFDCFQRENSWIKNWVLFYPHVGNLKYLKPSLFFKSFARLGELVLSGTWGNFIERTFAQWQKKIMNRSQTSTNLLKSDFNKLGRITVDDTQLEFHPNSPEAWIIDGYNKKMMDLGFSEMAKEKDSGLK